MNEKKPLIGMTREQLQQVAAEVGLPKFAGGQIARWIYQKRVTSIEEMTDLPVRGRNALIEKGYCVGREEPKETLISRDGTRKYLFVGVGGRDVEAVVIPDGERRTICVSSQAGCKMGCRFCFTGMQGYHGNLTAAQIVNQVLSVEESEELTNLVFMGMGEPCDNVDAVLKVIEILTSAWGLAWSPKRITLSSIGKTDGLRRVLDETKVHIAISLHSPYPAERLSLMPVEKGYRMEDVLALLRTYDFAHQRRLSFEYTMFRGVNDSMRHCHALARELRGLECRVNLIRYHKIPGVPLEPCSLKEMEAFRDTLNDLGVTATIRASKGEDIFAACGMLSGKEGEKE